MITKITNKEAQEELWAIEMMYGRMEDAQDNPGKYFAIRMQADKRMDAWRAKYPEADKERRYLNLIELAENKERLAVEADFYGDSESREDRIESFTKQALDYRKRADEIFGVKTGARV